MRHIMHGAASAIPVLFVTKTAHAGAMKEALGPDGPGFSIVLLLCIAAFGSLARQISSAMGASQVSDMIRLVTVFSCIGIVINEIVSALSKIASAFSINL